MLNRIKRLIKHRWQDDARASGSVPPDMVQRLQTRVAASERSHSGEIRIYVEASLPTSYLLRDAPTREITRDRALSLFGKLRVWDTDNNNGVLIYLLLAEHAIEIVADRGLNQWVTQQDWQAMVERMRAAFQEHRFEDGLRQAVDEVNTLLAQHFPLGAGVHNPNELPDRPIVK